MDKRKMFFNIFREYVERNLRHFDHLNVIEIDHGLKFTIRFRINDVGMSCCLHLYYQNGLAYFICPNSPDYFKSIPNNYDLHEHAIMLANLFVSEHVYHYNGLLEKYSMSRFDHSWIKEGF